MTSLPDNLQKKVHPHLSIYWTELLIIQRVKSGFDRMFYSAPAPLLLRIPLTIDAQGRSVGGEGEGKRAVKSQMAASGE